MKFKDYDKSLYPDFPAMEQAATYRIEVLGRLDSSWSERLAGMEITTTGGTGVVPRTILEGQVMDQSGLSGLLNTLCDLGYPLIAATYLHGDNEKYI